MTRPTIIDERGRRRDGGFAALTALVVAAIASPFFRDGSIDTSTVVALVVLTAIALAIAAYWIWLIRNPISLIVTDNAITLGARGPNGTERSIQRGDGAVRIRVIGGVRARTVVLVSERGDTTLPLQYLDREEVLDACHEHGWSFG